MKTIVLVVLACFVATEAAKPIERDRATRFKDHNKVEITEDAEDDYRRFMKTFYSTYKRDKHHDERKAKFMKCRQNAIHHKTSKAGYAKGLTHFCHWTKDEINSQWNHHIHNKSRHGGQMQTYTAKELRQAQCRDWTNEGAVVTDVKDQGQCGSCYTFAAAAALESACIIQKGQSTSLSTQQYVDCSGNGNQGCDGGFYTDCWDYNKGGKAQSDWNCYQYTAQQGSCQDGSCGGVSTVSDYTNIDTNNEDALAAALEYGPVACALDASGLDQYTGGILDPSTCSQTANHAITVVGCGTDENNQDYWKIKNSWGPNWGENGYFRIPRGVNACGIISNGCAQPKCA